jgi:hypothetical protein
MNTHILEKKLNELSFPELFLSGSRSLADDIWQGGKIQPQLELIIQKPSFSLYSKFLAAEILRHFSIPPDASQYAVLAKSYAWALENTSEKRGNRVHLYGNIWGMLYEEDDPGYLGKQLILFGASAIPFLYDLLDNTDRIFYEGSEEATIGNGYKYRIKDFAAFYISRIRNIPISFYQDIDKRDREIDRFIKLLNTDKHGRA